MTYPYNGRLAPAVGGGLGGLPRRKSVVEVDFGYASVPDSKILPELIVNNRWGAPNSAVPSGDSQGYNYAAVDAGDYLIYSLKIGATSVATHSYAKVTDKYGSQTVGTAISSKSFVASTAIYGPVLGKISDSAILHAYSDVGGNTINAKLVGISSTGVLSDLTNVASVNGGNARRPIKAFKVDDDSWMLVCMDSGSLYYYLISGITSGTLSIVAMAATGSDVSFSESYNTNGRISIKQLTPYKYIVATGVGTGCWMQVVTISGSSVTKATVYQVAGAQSGGIIPNPHVWVLGSDKVLIAYGRYTTDQGMALRTFDVSTSTVTPLSAEVFYPAITQLPARNRDSVSFAAGDVFCIFGVSGFGQALSALVRVNNDFVPRLVGGRISRISSPVENSSYFFQTYLPFSDTETNASGKCNVLGLYAATTDSVIPFTFSLGVLP